MKLMQSKKIYNCNEIEEEIHNQEINDIFERIFLIENYDCAILVKYQDTVHKDIEQKVLSSKLHDLDNLFELFDCKNGVDVFLDGEFIVFLVYGQFYLCDDEMNMNTVALKVLPFNDKRQFLDISGAIFNSYDIKIAIQQYDS